MQCQCETPSSYHPHRCIEPAYTTCAGCGKALCGQCVCPDNTCAKCDGEPALSIVVARLERVVASFRGMVAHPKDYRDSSARESLRYASDLIERLYSLGE